VRPTVEPETEAEAPDEPELKEDGTTR